MGNFISAALLRFYTLATTYRCNSVNGVVQNSVIFFAKQNWQKLSREFLPFYPLMDHTVGYEKG